MALGTAPLKRVVVCVSCGALDMAHCAFKSDWSYLCHYTVRLQSKITYVASDYWNNISSSK